MDPKYGFRFGKYHPFDHLRNVETLYRLRALYKVFALETMHNDGPEIGEFHNFVALLEIVDDGTLDYVYRCRFCGDELRFAAPETEMSREDILLLHDDEHAMECPSL